MSDDESTPLNTWSVPEQKSDSIDRENVNTNIRLPPIGSENTDQETDIDSVINASNNQISELGKKINEITEKLNDCHKQKSSIDKDLEEEKKRLKESINTLSDEKNNCNQLKLIKEKLLEENRKLQLRIDELDDENNVLDADNKSKTVDILDQNIENKKNKIKIIQLNLKIRICNFLIAEIGEALANEKQIINIDTDTDTQMGCVNAVNQTIDYLKEKAKKIVQLEEEIKKQKTTETKCREELIEYKTKVNILIKHITQHTSKIEEYNDQLQLAIDNQQQLNEVKGDNEDEITTNKDDSKLGGWREGADNNFTRKQREEVNNRVRNRKMNKNITGGARSAAAKRFLKHCNCDEKMTNGVEEAVCECLLSLNDNAVKMSKEDLKLLAKILRVPLRTLKGMQKAEVRVKLASRIKNNQSAGSRVVYNNDVQDREDKEKSIRSIVERLENIKIDVAALI